MDAHIIHERAERIRDVIRYLHRFKDALIIIYIDDSLIDSPIFVSHIKDISLLHQAGLKVILVPGAAKRIDEILSTANISWSFHKGNRITAQEAMPLIKMAAFDVSNQIMTSLAGEKITALIGNWVRARGKGVIDGFDYGTIGEIDKLQVNAISTVLENGFIPIFPCIGWSLAGKPYNISSIRLAQQIAIHLHADKLFYLVPHASICNTNFTIPPSFNLSPEGTIPAMTKEEVDTFLSLNEHLVNSAQNDSKFTERLDNAGNPQHIVPREKIFTLLRFAKDACESGVTRVHLLDGSLDGTISCEIFSDFGSGTMIYTNNYGKIRNMMLDDIPAVLSLIRPFVEQGILLPRTKQGLTDQCDYFIIYEIDGAIRACASLIPYDDGQMEIACVAVDKTCSHIGIGPKMILFLVKRAQNMKAKSVFLLTTQTADWFENLGFVMSDISTLPKERKSSWSPQRGSKLFRFQSAELKVDTEGGL